MAVGIYPQPPLIIPQVSDQGCVGRVLTTLIDAVKKIWALVLWLIEGVFHFATCDRYEPTMPPVTYLLQPPREQGELPTLVLLRPVRMTGRSPTLVVEEEDLVSMRRRDQYGLPTDVLQRIFVECLSKGYINDFKVLSRTNVHSYLAMRDLVNEVALTKLCPKLRILDAKTYTFHADLRGINKYNALQSYYKLEPFVEGLAGLTIIFNHGGLTFKSMKENPCGITVNVPLARISEELDNVPEEDTGAEMVSNAPVIGTRSMSPEVQETRVREEVGFDGKPTLIQHLALMIATQKELGICLYSGTQLNSGVWELLRTLTPTYGRTSTEVDGIPLVVGDSATGRLCVNNRAWCGPESIAAGGRLRL